MPLSDIHVRRDRKDNNFVRHAQHIAITAGPAIEQKSFYMITCSRRQPINSELAASWDTNNIDIDSTSKYSLDTGNLLSFTLFYTNYVIYFYKCIRNRGSHKSNRHQSSSVSFYCDFDVYLLFAVHNPSQVIKMNFGLI